MEGTPLPTPGPPLDRFLNPDLRNRGWKRFLHGPDPDLLRELYVPALAMAIRYDRCCAYFSSTILAAAARGFGQLIERLKAMGGRAPHPAIRLLVNEELTEPDLKALLETGDLSSLETQLRKRFKTPTDALATARLKMLAWLVKRNLLEIRVGVMRQTGGVLHAKFGVITDEQGNAIVFRGSGNESAQGILYNYENLEISTSWDDPEAHSHYRDEFETLWQDRHPDVHTVSLPEALRLKLIRLAPEQPPVVEPGVSTARQKAAMLWSFIAEAPYLPRGETACDATALVDLWPHQKRVVEEVASAWPEGRLLCDEVGLGKTIEASVVLRRLLAGRGVRRVLILLPAGLVRQWQGELREKAGILVPRLEGVSTLVWPDGRTERVAGLAQALEQDLLLMSRETARTENNLPYLLSAPPWDLVILDEAHAARRREQDESAFNSGTLLLTLIRELQLRRRARGFLFLSATPMQTHPWEPWDLLSVLGEGGLWLSDFSNVRAYFDAVTALEAGRCDIHKARTAGRLVSADSRYPRCVDMPHVDPRNAEHVANALAFATPQQREVLARWLRKGSPLARRMHRNTRATLKQYYQIGLLPSPPPQRNVKDVAFEYQDPAEQRVYNAITTYIDRRYEELEQEKRGKGFVMTIYRRRAASSPLALERSLERRLEALRRVMESKATDLYLDTAQEELDFRDLDDFVVDTDGPGHISAGLPSSPEAARREYSEVTNLLEQLRSLRGKDSRRDQFFAELREVTNDGRPVLVFTEYRDTLQYIRDNLLSTYGRGLACYSGDGGQRWDGTQWAAATKDAITLGLHRGEIQALICTDAASEGLNLQAAGALINYDLPWNPSKVEQRIGRIDRIGQQYPTVLVVNLFLKGSIDEEVYRVLRTRCGLFEHFVGAMQPVLAKARGMLLGHDRAPDPQMLAELADRIEQDHLQAESYIESDAEPPSGRGAILTREDLEIALRELPTDCGITVRENTSDCSFTISSRVLRKRKVSTRVESLQRDLEAMPLTPESSFVRQLVAYLNGDAQRLPLVIGSYAEGGFRASVAVWVDGNGVETIADVRELRQRLDKWSGGLPDPGRWLAARQFAEAEAKRLVISMRDLAQSRHNDAIEAQLSAARERLTKELGRFLVCLGTGADNLNEVFYQHMSRDVSTAARLREVFERLGSRYPDWSSEACQELAAFYEQLSENQRKARLLGREVDAALQDPRWKA